MAGPSFTAGHSTALNGVAEFSRKLRMMDPLVKRGLDRKNREIGKMVIERGKGKAEHYSRQAAAASAAMSATAAGGGVGIRLSKAKVPFAFGAEFGAKKWPQFPRWRGNQFTNALEGIGYFMHPAIRESMPEVVEQYYEAVEEAGRAVGIPVHLSAFGAGNLFDIARG